MKWDSFKGIWVVCLFVVSHAAAAAEKTTAALSLLEPSTARAFALGEAFSAATEDASAFHYNPASLPSLRVPEMSVFYRQGVFEDFYSRLSFGRPLRHGSLGASVGYYSTGPTELFEDNSTRVVTGQQDLAVSLGYGAHWNSLAMGGTVKYFSSTIAETESATAYAADLGIQYQLTKRLSLGSAVQNIGTDLSYSGGADPLPRLLRAGLAWKNTGRSYPVQLFVENLYQLNAQTHEAAMGLEVEVSPLVLRAGYRHHPEQDSLSMGLGFLIGQFSLDYSLAMVRDLDAQHMFSLTHRFGRSDATSVATEISAPRNVVLGATSAGSLPRSDRLYRVSEGETWDSIATKIWGTSQLASTIRRANAHIFDVTKNPPAGMQIILPD